LDTSTVLRLDELDVEDLPKHPAITTVTLAELSVGPLVARDAKTRAARQVQVQNAEANYGDPLPFDAEAARAFGQVTADLRAGGRTAKVCAFDAVIAAIAKAVRLPIYTFNAADFRPISDLEVISLSEGQD
jgi:predicted nucleic acid-binding protein